MLIFFLSVVPLIALALYSFLLFVTWRRGLEKRVNRSFAVYLISMIVWSLGALMMYMAPGRALFWNKVMLSGVSLMPLAFFSFVRAFRGLRAYRWVFQAAVGAWAVLFVFSWFGFMVTDIYLTEDGLIHFVLGPLTPFFALYYLPLLIFSMVLLAQGLRESRDAVERNRIKYVLLGLVIIFVGGFTNLVGELGAFPVDVAANAVNALLIAYAIFRYDLLDINEVVRKGLLYMVPTIIIGVGYFLIILLAVGLFRLVAGYQIAIVSILVAAVAALAMQPLQSRTQLWIDKLFFREKYDAGLMLQRLSRTASSILDLDRLTHLILNEIVETMHITKAVLFLREKESGVFHLAAQRGLPHEIFIEMRADHPVLEWLASHTEILTRHQIDITPRFKALWAQEIEDLDLMETQLFVPLVAQNMLIGLLALGPKMSGANYSPDEKLVLITLANQTAIAVQNAWLYQQALEEKERTEIILEQAFAGMIVVDEDMRIIVVNPAAESITGHHAHELLGEFILQAFPREMWDVGSPLYTAIETGESVGPVEVELAVGEGRRDLLVGVTPILDGYLINFTDITKLKEVARLQSNIVMNVSHELRTPLTSIKGYAELLMTQFADNPVMMRRFLEVIQSEADRMNRIINDLLDLSRLESGRYRPEKTYLDMVALVRESVKGLEMQAQQAGVEIALDLPTDLPPLFGDRELLVSVVNNLVGNAIKFSTKGGRVRVALYQQDGALVLEVEDNGLGIPEEDIPHLFTKFYRSERVHKAGIKGTGLGLALVKQAVELHNGVIQVESRVGVGSRFIVMLPLEMSLAPRATVPETAFS
ncbi:MAG: PAS domain S-box protein [Chloroflexi bacterium]|nr:PAS domain S-box protein [Chloroflexota bacterium]